MFKKILIANRGEIACRIMRTARTMGIATVAVYSEADADAVHVEMADEAVEIGPAAVARSYLSIERIIAACRETGAEAVHPGYGFLSENAEFCERLEAEGIVFIGPKAAAIRAMGDKITSKKIAAGAGVFTVPGVLGVVEGPEQAVKIAAEIGYPVMIKASAGGGGKGMRIARNDVEVREGFERARSEAASSFGDDRIFIEKYIEEPRHIEIQVLADGFGNCIHLGERECSIQRRNQKVVEEAPSPFLDEGTRQDMGAQAVALAKAVDYQSAGTVEFIVDRNHNFYFLEMNTRLQVEHPVTELVTGIDLVAEMIRIAAGKELRLAQGDVRLNGWAIESRLYAEDPTRGFLPSIGRLTRYLPPKEGRHGDVVVRNDSGVTEGSEISVFYDPMIAKLCTWAPDRAAAIEAMSAALDRLVIDGIAHNVPFLATLMRNPRWREGRLSTSFIAEEYPDGFSIPKAGKAERAIFCAVALAIELLRLGRLERLPGRIEPRPSDLRRDWVVKLDQDYVPVSLIEGTVSLTELKISVDGSAPFGLTSSWRPGEPIWEGRVGGEDVAIQVRPVLNGFELSRHGVASVARVMAPRVAELDRLMPATKASDASKKLLCPMPGLVVSIAVEEGQEVKAGEVLAVVEAMKMENVLRAERDCVVAAIRAMPGDSLAVDAVILEFA